MVSRRKQRRQMAAFSAMAAVAVGVSLLIAPLASGDSHDNAAPLREGTRAGTHRVTRTQVHTEPLPIADVPVEPTSSPETSPNEVAPIAAPEPATTCTGSVNPDLCNIDHVIFIVQENRSFDHYFGMYKNPNDYKVNGYPRKPSGAIKPSTCNPHPVLSGCFLPYHTTNDSQIGGPHEHDASVRDVAGGKMNGFIFSAGDGPATRECTLNPYLGSCQKFEGPKHQPDVMSYRLRKDIPNYWALADWGVLQDRLFASVDSYSLPAHQFILSGWAATCSGGPMTCKSSTQPASSNFSWTPIPYLLDQQGVDWNWYVGEDTNVCQNYPNCAQQAGDAFSSTNWNVAPGFTYIRDVSGLNHVKPVSAFHTALGNNNLPAVSWIIPDEQHSEHPGKGSMRPGYTYVSNLIDEIGASGSWNNTAIWLYWDDWGGFYDHMQPPRVDHLGYGVRVPGILISPYAKVGWVDHQTNSFDSFLKFIEDRWLNGSRLDPNTMGRPDARPSVRENEPNLGDLTAEFDFTQPPRPAPVLPD